MSLKHALVKNALAAGKRQDAEMGAQLSAQYERATGGMREVLKFGCMMMMLRAHLVSKLDTRKLPTAKASDGGIKAWIEEHAPDVQRSTAYRFEDVAKAVAQAYQLPAKVAKQLTFEQLVTAQDGALTDQARKARTHVFEFVAGTSQKSWLDQFREAKLRGGARNPSTKKLSAEEEHAQFLAAARADFVSAFETLDRLHRDKSWQVVEDAILQAGVDLAKEFAKAGSAWLATPQKQRQALPIITEDAE